MANNDQDIENHHAVGQALMLYSVVGFSLGAAMLVRGVSDESFITGPGAIAIGGVTLLVGAVLRFSGGRRTVV
jgi:hypothetical protein